MPTGRSHGAGVASASFPCWPAIPRTKSQSQKSIRTSLGYVLGKSLLRYLDRDVNEAPKETNPAHGGSVLACRDRVQREQMKSKFAGTAPDAAVELEGLRDVNKLASESKAG
jgi:hypothetical protein